MESSVLKRSSLEKVVKNNLDVYSFNWEVSTGYESLVSPVYLLCLDVKLKVDVSCVRIYNWSARQPL